MLGGGQRMCSKCHDNTKAAQADNWKTKPSRLACGACHDGINWATGTGTTLADKAEGLGKASGHCRQAATRRLHLRPLPPRGHVLVENHQTENVTKHNPTVPAGLKNISYEIKSAAVDARRTRPRWCSGCWSTAAPATFKAACGRHGQPARRVHRQPELPARLRDGRDRHRRHQRRPPTTPTPASSRRRRSAFRSRTCSIRPRPPTVPCPAPDANGYYTATLLGTGTKKFPVGATMRAVALQGYFTQVSPAAARHAISVVKEVTGDAVRRKVVDADKCSNCHEWFEGHGGNRVYQTQVCVMCHVPGPGHQRPRYSGFDDEHLEFQRGDAEDRGLLEVRQDQAQCRTGVAGHDEQLQGLDPRHPCRQGPRQSVP